jgi:hypothetical protein
MNTAVHMVVRHLIYSIVLAGIVTPGRSIADDESSNRRLTVERDGDIVGSVQHCFWLSRQGMEKESCCAVLCKRQFN